MAGIEGGKKETILCDTAFWQFGAWTGVAMGMASVAWPVMIAVGLSLAVAEYFVC